MNETMKTTTTNTTLKSDTAQNSRRIHYRNAILMEENLYMHGDIRSEDRPRIWLMELTPVLRT